jgi:predicted PolB exonuclease-like 3'-5' exonuclease
LNEELEKLVSRREKVKASRDQLETEVTSLKAKTKGGDQKVKELQHQKVKSRILIFCNFLKKKEIEEKLNATKLAAKQEAANAKKAIEKATKQFQEYKKDKEGNNFLIFLQKYSFDPTNSDTPKVSNG